MSNSRNSAALPLMLRLAPLIVLGALVPLVLYIKPTNLDEVTSSIMNLKGPVMDIYSYYKMFIASLSGFFMACMLIYYKGTELRDTLNSRKMDNKILLVFGLLMLLTLSTVFSSYKSIAIIGFADRFEGYLAFLTYFITVIFSFYFIESKDDVYKIIKYIGFSSLIITIIGLLEYFGYALLSQKWFIKLIMNDELFKSIKSLSYSLGAHRVSSTLYNPNFVGSYMALIISILLGYMVDKRETKASMIILVLLPLLGFALSGSKSSAGIIGVIVGIIIFVIGLMITKPNKKTISLVILSIFLVFGSFIVEPMVSGGKFIITSELESITDKSVMSEHIYKNIDIEPTYLQIDYDDLRFKLSLEGDKLEFQDLNGNILNYKMDSNSKVMKFDDPRYKDVALQFTNDNSSALLKIGKLDMAVGFTANGLSYSDPMGNVYSQEPIIESIGFKGNERFGNSRGYIWSRSFPIIKETLIIGKGPDTFPIYYPQYDLLGKINYLGDYRLVVDKPHNMYIQMAVSTGVISVIIFISLMAMIGIKLLLDLIKRRNASFIRIGAVSAILGYCASAFFNDSNICVSPVFWTIVGISVALERIENLEYNNTF